MHLRLHLRGHAALAPSLTPAARVLGPEDQERVELAVGVVGIGRGERRVEDLARARTQLGALALDLGGGVSAGGRGG